MNYKNIFKRETKIIVYVVICLTLVVLGTSYALFLQVNNNSNNQVVQAGSLTITYTDGQTINATDEDDDKNCLNPVSNTDGAGSKGCQYKFSAQNSGTLPMTYDLLIYKDATATRAGTTDVNFNQIHYSLTKEHTNGSQKSSETLDNSKNTKKLSDLKDLNGDSSKKVLETAKIDAKENITFTLKIWIDENAEESIIGQNVNLKLEVKGKVYENEETLASKANVGDYVTYTPFQTSFTISPDDTGSDQAQTINPSSLKKWRILNKDTNGIDLISVDVSSEKIKFKGQTGYKNYVGTLNKLAEAYEDKAYTTKSRMPGYSNQTENITENLSTSCGNSTGISGWQETLEPQGCGDLGYQTDESKLKTVFNSSLIGKTGETATSYWLASRWYGQTGNQYSARLINESGEHTQKALYESTDKEVEAALRPIVTLKSGVEVASGSGTAEDPYVLSDFIKAE